MAFVEAWPPFSFWCFQIFREDALGVHGLRIGGHAAPDPEELQGLLAVFRRHEVRILKPGPVIIHPAVQLVPRALKGGRPLLLGQFQRAAAAMIGGGLDAFGGHSMSMPATAWRAINRPQ